MEGLRVHVDGGVVSRPYEFKDRVTGVVRRGETHRQAAYVYLGGRFPVPLAIRVAEPESAYSEGEYVLAPDQFQVYGGKLEVKRYPVLIKAGVRAAASRTA